VVLPSGCRRRTRPPSGVRSCLRGTMGHSRHPGWKQSSSLLLSPCTQVLRNPQRPSVVRAPRLCVSARRRMAGVSPSVVCAASALVEREEAGGWDSADIRSKLSTPLQGDRRSDRLTPPTGNGGQERRSTGSKAVTYTLQAVRLGGEHGGSMYSQASVSHAAAGYHSSECCRGASASTAVGRSQH